MFSSRRQKRWALCLSFTTVLCYLKLRNNPHEVQAFAVSHLSHRNVLTCSRATQPLINQDGIVQRWGRKRRRGRRRDGALPIVALASHKILSSSLSDFAASTSTKKQTISFQTCGTSNNYHLSMKCLQPSPGISLGFSSKGASATRFRGIIDDSNRVRMNMFFAGDEDDEIDEKNAGNDGNGNLRSDEDNVIDVSATSNGDVDIDGDGEENGADSPHSKKLGNRLRRLLNRDKKIVEQIPLSDYDGNGDMSDLSSGDEDSSMPDWLREEQEERERLRRLASDQRRTDNGDGSKPVVETTSKLEDLLSGMPSLSEILADEGSPEARNAGFSDDAPDESTMEDIMEVHRRAAGSGSLTSAAKAGGLNQRLKDLVGEAFEDVDVKDGNTSPVFDIDGDMDDMDDYDDDHAPSNEWQDGPVRPVDLLRKKTPSQKSERTSTPISEQRYRSFATTKGRSTKKGTGDTKDEKREQFQEYLKKEYMLRKKAGLTDKVDDGETSQKGISAGSSSGKARAKKTEDRPPSIDEVLPSHEEYEDTYYDVYGDNADLARFRPQSVSAADQRYRSFAKNATTSDKKQQWEAFLRKEQEIREKAGLTAYDEDKKRNADDDDGERGVFSPPQEDLSSLSDELIDAEDEDEGSLPEIDSLKGGKRSVSDQRFRSFSPKSSSGQDVDEKRLEWEAFQKKETEMRESLGLSTSDQQQKEAQDVEEVTDTTTNTGSKTSRSRHYPHSAPKTSFFEGYHDEDYIEEEPDDNQADIDSIDDEEEDSIDADLEDYRPEESYYIASDLFGRDPFGERARIEQSSFSSYDVRKKDLLEYTELSVSDLNSLFEHDPLRKLEAANKPDAAFGAIFRLEGLLVDTTELQMEAWTKVAAEHGFREPLLEEVQLAQQMRADVAVREVFFWTFDMVESRDVALTHFDALEECFDERMQQINATKIENTVTLGGGGGKIERKTEVAYVDFNATAAAELFPVAEGAMEWLFSLKQMDIPCAVVSHFDKTKLEVLLNLTRLALYVPENNRVSSSNGYDRESVEYLGASLRLERRPDHCFVVDVTPTSAVEAHEVEMLSIAFMGVYARYELANADLSVASFDELNVINVRKLFDGKNFELEVELEGKKPETKPKKRLRQWFEGDRD